MKFINRVWEINELDKYSKSGKLMVIYGRRRVGKTTLITHWLKSKKGVYSQAIEGSSLLQIGQVCEDLREILKSEIQPQNWVQFFELLEKSVNENTIICLDEFPYLVESDPSLPSILQKWMDHKKHSKINFILSGSSQKMMHSIFLNHSSPLFGRATRVLKVEPMTYIDFCAACGLNKKNMESFILYSMVGGLPKYWEALNVIKECESIDLANLLYFDRGALLENEPRRILSDEKVEGITPVSVLEAIGRGSHRPSEISSRIGVKQSSLSKVFSQLIDISLIERQIPFGSPEKDAKKTLYKITDPMLNFWYSVYSALRSQ
ncbi:MAG: AAA family ATPase, partial [Pseudobdellovibrionaceae bacterium]